MEKGKAELEKSYGEDEQVDENKKISEEMAEYPTLKKTYTHSSSNDNEIERNSVELQKDCNKKSR